MKYISLQDVLKLHKQVIEAHGGEDGIRDLGLLESAIAQPRATFDGQDLNPTLIDKAAALAYTIANNHPFIDGNKRIAQSAMESFLNLNGFELFCDVDEQETIFLRLADSNLSKAELAEWLDNNIIELKNPLISSNPK